MNNAAAITSLVPTPEQRRSDFGIGASEAAAAIGVSEYQRPIDAWLVKTGRRPGFAGNEKTRWGNTLEPVIRAHYVERNGVAVHVPPESLFHKDHAWLRATPDGIVLDDDGHWLFVGPQVKNVGLRMAPAWEIDGQRTTPTDYYVQGVVEMAVTNLPRIDFAVLLGGQEYFEVTLERDHDIERDVLEQLAAFWRLVDTDTQPAIDDSDSFRGHLLRQIKRRAHVEAVGVDLDLIARWRDVAIEAKRLKSEERSIKNQIAASLAAKDAHRMTSDLGDITVGAARKKTAWKSVAEQLSTVLASLTVVERELVGLRADAAVDDGIVGKALVQRIDGLRAGLRLVGDFHSFSALLAKNTTHGDPNLNRPRAWTKDISDDEEAGE